MRRVHLPVMTQLPRACLSLIFLAWMCSLGACLGPPQVMNILPACRTRVQLMWARVSLASGVSGHCRLTRVWCQLHRAESTVRPLGLVFRRPRRRGPTVNRDLLVEGLERPALLALLNLDFFRNGKDCGLRVMSVLPRPPPALNASVFPSPQAHRWVARHVIIFNAVTSALPPYSSTPYIFLQRH